MNKDRRLKVLFFSIFILICSPLLQSCENIFKNSQTHIYPGRTEIIGKSTDLSLSDSVLIFGHVFSAIDNKTFETNSRIWIEPTNLETVSNDSGYYSLKTISDSYTIRCQGRFGNSNEIETLENLYLAPNEKIELNFYLGTRVE